MGKEVGNSYLLDEIWFELVQRNPSLIKPLHHAIHKWCVHKANRSRWMDDFQLPTDEACNMLGIGKKDTFLKGLKDLVSFGVIKIVAESKNIYTARYISFTKSDLFIQKCRTKKRDSKGDSIGLLKGC